MSFLVSDGVFTGHYIIRQNPITFRTAAVIAEGYGHLFEISLDEFDRAPSAAVLDHHIRVEIASVLAARHKAKLFPDNRHEARRF